MGQNYRLLSEIGYHSYISQIYFHGFTYLFLATQKRVFVLNADKRTTSTAVLHHHPQYLFRTPLPVLLRAEGHNVASLDTWAATLPKPPSRCSTTPAFITPPRFKPNSRPGNTKTYAFFSYSSVAQLNKIKSRWRRVKSGVTPAGSLRRFPNSYSRRLAHSRLSRPVIYHLN